MMAEVERRRVGGLGWVVFLALACAFMYWGWPGRYVFVPFADGLKRIDRLTGKEALSTPEGWQAVNRFGRLEPIP